MFYINLSIGTLALVALSLYLPSQRSATGMGAWRRIDFSGAALVSGTTICLLLGLSWGGDQTYAWTPPQVMLILAGAAVLAIPFILVEGRAAEPIIPITLFRAQTVAANAVIALGIGLVLLPLVIYLPLFVQGILGVAATHSGLAIALFVGLLLLTRLTASIPIGVAGVFMVVAGLGIGMYLSITTLIMQNAVPRDMLGVGTSRVRYVQALGQTLGVASVGTIVNNTLHSGIGSHQSHADRTTLTPKGVRFAADR